MCLLFCAFFWLTVLFLASAFTSVYTEAGIKGYSVPLITDFNELYNYDLFLEIL